MNGKGNFSFNPQMIVSSPNTSSQTPNGQNTFHPSPFFSPQSISQMQIPQMMPYGGMSPQAPINPAMMVPINPNTLPPVGPQPAPPINPAMMAQPKINPAMMANSNNTTQKNKFSPQNFAGFVASPEPVKKVHEAPAIKINVNDLMKKIETKEEENQGVSPEFWDRLEKLELSLKAQGKLNLDGLKNKCSLCRKKFDSPIFLLQHTWECHRDAM